MTPKRLLTLSAWSTGILSVATVLSFALTPQYEDTGTVMESGPEQTDIPLDPILWWSLNDGSHLPSAPASLPVRTSTSIQVNLDTGPAR